MTEKVYKPGSIGAQLQARGIPEDRWGEVVTTVRTANQNANVVQREADKLGNRAVKKLAGGAARGSIAQIIEGARAWWGSNSAGALADDIRGAADAQIDNMMANSDPATDAAEALGALASPDAWQE
jgi:hypothetical protein